MYSNFLRSLRSAGFGLTAVLVLVTNTPADDRIAVPDKAAQDKTLSGLRDVFKSDFDAAESSARKLDLSRKLLAVGIESKEAATDRFVLFQEARRLATEAVAVDDALAISERIGNEFQLDELALQAETIAGLTGTVQSAQDRKALAERALVFLEEAMQSHRIEIAQRMATSALTAARGARDQGLIKKITGQQQELEKSVAVFNQGQAALAALEKNPQDADARTTAGRFLCLFQGNWERGLPLLVEGNDKALQAIAKQEQSAGNQARDLVAVGDAWFDLSAREKSVLRAGMKSRSQHWYNLALAADPPLTGLHRTKVDQRLALIEKEIAPAGAGSGRTSTGRPKSRAQVQELVIEALIDGNSRFHLTSDGIYWTSHGVSKPGRHDGKNEPTYVNGQPWMPVWGNPQLERGNDITQPAALAVGQLNFTFELLAVRSQRGDAGIDNRDEVKVSNTESEIVVDITDGQGGSRWYTFRLKRGAK